MSVSKTNEQAFEAFIEKALVGSSKEEREALGQTDIDAQIPAEGQYYWGSPKDMDKKLAIDTRRLWSFLRSTQQAELDKYKGGNVEKDLLKRIDAMIRTRGVIDVLRQGVSLANINLKLFYPKPSAADAEVSKRQYAANQFSLTRQQTFSEKNPCWEVDMVLYVNGLPIFTFELKNPWTHQTARRDGQHQYRSPERSPEEPLLSFARCLAHFTMDKDEVFFTSRLSGKDTFFMPFNQGLPEGAGAGNPVNSNGYKTSYMWEQVLQKDCIADIIMNYVLLDYGNDRKGKTLELRYAKKLIFPRYHQLDVVNRLTADVAQHGVGKTYLIQHSAGSGKSNSLTWLAYKLIKVCPNSMDAQRAVALDSPLFSSVIVVTDRRLLDKQISDNIRAFGQSTGIMKSVDSSKELKMAIEGGKRIITTTIQKFPFICDAIRDVSDRNFAVIIDEAHSSQSGIAADKLNASLQKGAAAEYADTDALLEKLMNDRKMSSNCSYFAFTATPKKETLERFGTRDEEGKFHPFHLYSMKQAIEEQFILDVLTNYTTYKSYYELIKSTEGNPEYNSVKAQKLLRKAVERDPKTIAAKAEEMLSHFDAKVCRTYKLKGKARAMVVTQDIECAIRYYQALSEIAAERKLPYKILIAFSGEKTIDGIEYTEAKMNGFSEESTRDMFKTDAYRILVVANKYLTGFDEPNLCAMYIDKPLDGVLAVQALSRLNRAAPQLGKRNEDLFILDFYNSIEDIKAAFDPFYTSTMLSEATDVNVLHDLQSTLLSSAVFDMEEVNAFIEAYVRGEEAAVWAPIIDKAAHRFKQEIEWYEDGKADFKMKCKQFVKVYSKVAAITSYNVPDWEKLYWFLRHLIPQLHIEDAVEQSIRDLLDCAELSTYGFRQVALNNTIELDATAATIDPNKAVMVHAGSGADESTDTLDQIIQDFNKRYFKDWDATPEEQKTKLIEVTKRVLDNQDYQTYVVNNTDKPAAQEAKMKIISKVMLEKRRSEASLYQQYSQNEEFKEYFFNIIDRMLSNPSYFR